MADHSNHPRVILLCASGLFVSVIAATMTVWLILKSMLARVSHSNAQETADAVGVALGLVLDERPPPRPRLIRRGT